MPWPACFPERANPLPEPIFVVVTHTDRTVPQEGDAMTTALAGTYLGSATPRAARILVVDDDDLVRRAVVRVLASAGYVTEEAANGREGIERYRAAPADLVLSDVYMPGTDGVEAMIRLRAEFPDIRIIAMSGGGHRVASDVLAMATRLGAQATLEKPVGGNVLLQAIQDVLGTPV